MLRNTKKIINTSLIIGLVLSTSLSKSLAASKDWYPESAAPYAGTQFHCDLKALPSDMPGIKDEDKQFIDHTMAVLLKCAQEKELMLTKLGEGKGAESLARYEQATNAQVTRLKTVAAPAGLETFKSDVEKAILLQVTFFQKAVAAQTQGATMDTIMKITEGHQASEKLFAAWDEMQHRYWLFWNGPSKDCIYHHLCAYDLF